MSNRGIAVSRLARFCVPSLSVLVICVVTALALPACSPLGGIESTTAPDTATVTSPATQMNPADPTPAEPLSELDRILDRGVLRVATLRAPIGFYADPSQDGFGPDHALAIAFARSLGVEAEFVVENSRARVYAALKEGRADLAAASLAVTMDRKHEFGFSAPLAETRQQLVCRRFGEEARTPEALSSVRLAVTDDLASLATLWAMQYRYKGIQWQVHEGSSQEQMLWKVWNNEVDCTLADKHIVVLAQRVMPELRVMFDASEKLPVAWATGPDDSSLLDTVNRWVTGDGASMIAAVRYDYYSGVDNFNYVDTRMLIRRMESRFPRYRDLMQQAAAEHELDPWLLAALSYQESHWDPRAKSPTGVRGLMMLTRSTAKALGVTNRLDPRQVVPAGARYLAELRETFDSSIPEPDRTYMALAAYNIGRGRLHDAQTLARKLGKNPHNWLDLKQALPLLCEQQPGSCKGHRFNLGAEAVRYVDRIHFYRDIIDANRHDRILLAYKNSHLNG